jgi:hypothetical protein
MGVAFGHILQLFLRPLYLWISAPADAAMLNAMSQLQALVEALPELPDEVQGALAVRVPGLLDTPAAEVGT